jgi:hypothetical protein
MAISDKNIVITPNVSGILDNQPKIVFTGADSSIGDSAAITLTARPENSGTLSFTGDAGQLFSITNSLSGTIFAVSDISGIPSLEIHENGIVKLAEYSGRVLVGTDSDDSSSLLQIAGNVRATAYYGDGSNLTGVSGDADTLDGINSTSFLRSDAADTKTSGDLTFSDNVKALFGTASDLEIYHDGSNSIINDAGTGALQLQIGGSTKLEIVSGGATITGTATATTFSGSGASLTSLNASNLASGTIPDARFPAALPAIDGSALTGISSGGGGAVNDIFLRYNKTVDSNYTIDSDGSGRGVTALTAADDSSGLTIATGVTVTVNSGSSWVVSGGDKNMGLDAMVATSNQTERTMRTGTIKPTLDNTYDLGDSAVGWRNIYTNDLNLSNINSSGNDIDGTTGKWTIQEGADQLYVINKINGKKYKFMLEEAV